MELWIMNRPTEKIQEIFQAKKRTMNNGHKKEVANDDDRVFSKDLEQLIDELQLSQEDIEVAKHIVGSDPGKVAKFLKERHGRSNLPLW